MRSQKSHESSYGSSRLIKKQKLLSLALLFCLLAAFVSAAGIVYLKLHPPQIEESNDKLQIKTTLHLKEHWISIEKGSIIDYPSYVLEASTGQTDRKEEVTFKEIDTQKSGTFAVFYELPALKDGTGSKQAVLLVRITEKQEQNDQSEKEEKAIEDENPKEGIQPDTEIETGKQETEKTPETKNEVQEPVPNQKQNNEAVSNVSSNSQNPQKETTEEAQKSTAIQAEPVTRYFLFSDGYDMDTVGKACEAAGKETGLSWSCQPLKDEEGIYLGMKLEAGK